LRVEHETRSAFRNHLAIGFRVHFAEQNLLDVERQQLQAVGIDAAQIGGDQGFGGDAGLIGGHPGCHQDFSGKLGQSRSKQDGHEPLRVPAGAGGRTPMGTFTN